MKALEAWPMVWGDQWYVADGPSLVVPIPGGYAAVFTLEPAERT